MRPGNNGQPPFIQGGKWTPKTTPFRDRMQDRLNESKERQDQAAEEADNVVELYPSSDLTPLLYVAGAGLLIWLLVRK